MSDIYCGSGKLPKGKRHGTMKECVERGKISLYGLKKADPRLIEGVKKKKGSKKPPTESSVFAELVKYKTRDKKLKEKIKLEKVATTKKKLEKDLEKNKKLKKKYSDMMKQFN